MKYGHLFDTQQEHDQAYVNRASGGDYIEPWVGYTLENEIVTYDKEMAKRYLTFEALEDGTFKFSGNSVDYSINGGETWITLASGTDTPTVKAGQRIMFKTTATASSEGTGTFSSTGRFNAMGHAYSIGYGDNFESITTLNRNYYLKKLFYGCAKLVSAENLVLQATTLKDRCYYQMFEGCTSLKIGPRLPATVLKPYCYYDMFTNCRSLTKAPELSAVTLAEGCYAYMLRDCSSLSVAPELPAKTLASSCYQNMFYGCTSLTKAPTLLAATLTYNCYYRMFYGCTRLKYIKMLATDISAEGCLSSWVNNVSSTGTFEKSSLMTSLPTGASGIPTGWTVEDVLPDYLKIESLGSGNVTITIPAAIDSTFMTSISWSKNGTAWTDTTIDNTAQTITVPVVSGDTVYLKGTGNRMSDGTGYTNITSSANYNISGNILSLLYGNNFMARTDFASWLNNFMTSLFRNSTTLINAENLIMNTSSAYNGCYAQMFRGCTSLLTSPKILPATSLYSGCYANMFLGCSSLRTAPKLPATNLGSGYAYNQMFYGCSSLTEAPELPATTLTPSCYNGMFYQCTSLKYIKMLATDISAANCLLSWVSGVSPTGTFVKNSAMTTLPSGASGIPNGWTVQNA